MRSELLLIRTNPGSFVSRRGYKGVPKFQFFVLTGLTFQFAENRDLGFVCFRVRADSPENMNSQLSVLSEVVTDFHRNRNERGEKKTVFFKLFSKSFLKIDFFTNLEFFLNFFE